MIDFIINRATEKPKDFHFTYELVYGYSIHTQHPATVKHCGTTKLMIIGDCINISDFSDKELSITDTINQLKGNYYAFLIDESSLNITSSAFGLLPIFYLLDFSCIASSVGIIQESTHTTLTQNKKWTVNQLLFNFQFSEDSYFKEIKLFPAMSYLSINYQSNEFIRYYSVMDELLDNPISWKKALPSIAKLFIETTQNYIPLNNSLVSFTGGFDGRTIVSIATNFKRKFSTVSYGKIENDDVYLPKANSKKLKIPYTLIELEKEYSNKHYYNSAVSYISKSSGQNGFLYANVDYFSKNIKNKGTVLLSGICGSELFRAAHSSGAVTSKALIDLVRIDDLKEYKNAIFESETLKYIDKNYFNNELQNVIEETWSYKQELLKNGLDKNKALYVFVYE
jgi:hypothetical protein